MGDIETISTEYAAPEQFDPEQFGDPDKYTDIYQLGAIVYALLTGSPLYTGSYTEIKHGTVSLESPTLPSEHRSELPTEVDDLIRTAVARKKSDRYTDVMQFGEELRVLRNEVLDGSEIRTERNEQSVTDKSKTDSTPGTDIAVVGVGNAGGNTVTRITEAGGMVYGRSQ